jgi:hypothetical protein
MSVAMANIWITQQGKPCTIENKKTLFVYFLHCDGRVLEWCGKRYVGLPAKCGHLQIEIPVGCYIVGAVENPSGIPPLGNHLTHIAIIRANCGDHVCVTLFNPTLHHCATWLQTAAAGHLGGPAAPAGEVNAALRNTVQALDGLIKALPPDEFTVTQAKELAPQTPPRAQKGKKR